MSLFVYPNFMQTKIKTQSLDFLSAKILSLLVLGLFIAIVPAFIHNQWLTGPFVNALLILTCVLVGPMEAVILGLIPSTVALSSGLLPLPLAPMIPFIVISNAIFVAVFHYLNKKSFGLGVIAGAFLKYVFLFAFATLLAQQFFNATLLPKVVGIMSWPQFATALIGGIFAYGILKFLKQN